MQAEHLTLAHRSAFKVSVVVAVVILTALLTDAKQRGLQALPVYKAGPGPAFLPQGVERTQSGHLETTEAGDSGGRTDALPDAHIRGFLLPEK